MLLRLMIYIPKNQIIIFLLKETNQPLAQGFEYDVICHIDLNNHDSWDYVWVSGGILGDHWGAFFSKFLGLTRGFIFAQMSQSACNSEPWCDNLFILLKRPVEANSVVRKNGAPKDQKS